MKFINTLLQLFCLISCLLISSASAEEGNTEYKIKAGYLYNFIKFVTWPTDNATSFNICIFGQDPFGELLNPIEKRTAFGLPIKLFRFSTGNKTQSCHIIFISPNNKALVALNDEPLLRNNRKALLVGEGEVFAGQGGMIGFINRDGKIKLQINLKALQQSDLTVSAKLLEVAEIIGGEGHE